MKNLRNVLGAFGDAAILFPILVLLNTKVGVPMSSLLVYTGIIYICAALFYRLPMPVQPLKSIAMAAVGVGATFNEIRVAAVGVGVACLSLLLLGDRLEQFLKRVPIILIHQLQVGLGVLLFLQAVKALGYPALGSLEGLLIAGVIVGLVLKPEWKGVPILGVVATLAFLGGLVKGYGALPTGISLLDDQPLRWSLIFSLGLPQIALTMGNSVLSTKIICNQLYPQQSERVSFRKLLAVIGVGNILMGWWGGMPFCHGSGGLTAHQRAGSNHWWSTAFLGTVLIGLALVLGNGSVVIPIGLLAVLLATVGVFHLKLAQSSWRNSWGKINLLGAAGIVIWTQNLLWVVAVFAFVEMIKRLESRYGVLPRSNG